VTDVISEVVSGSFWLMFLFERARKWGMVWPKSVGPPFL